MKKQLSAALALIGADDRDAIGTIAAEPDAIGA